MPRPGLPPTPASSTDISGKQDATLSQIESAFALPPAAMAAGNQNSNTSSRTSMSSSTSSANQSSDSSYRPMSPTSPNAVPRKRSSAALHAGGSADDFALPPPPTRSRKIIQMKPRGQEEKPSKPAQQAVEVKDQQGPSSTTPAGNKTAVTQNAGGRKKQANGNTAAGRKIARKTAHSLIERRRRSKMNEEFGVLKDMIPACAGQEMHKLAILQASIEYLRYLEKCVSDLQAASRSPYEERKQKNASLPPNYHPEPIENEDDNEDEEMADSPGSGTSTPSAQTSNAQAAAKARPMAEQSPYSGLTKPPSSAARPILPSISPILSNASSANASPAIHPTDNQQAHHGSRHYSSSSYITHASSGYLNSALPSPSLETFANQKPFGSSGSLAEFRLASPALKPQADPGLQEKIGSASSSSSPINAYFDGRGFSSDSHRRPTCASHPSAAFPGNATAQSRARSSTRVKRNNIGDNDLDQQATAALLMLNADRRSWDAEETRGMSVRDLLRD
ncbi:hypothetical protein EV356DRAFT_534043 [Viridothelium virens]|uniref:BHLH domain-containing protein n=1 Tax=Viridothelium virens TaxID=1048519 RepID=A0A6A6H4W6_VIRVR|nr:hypothetical protein EV356DRAFT_534043 [Viridothelium virens]